MAEELLINVNLQGDGDLDKVEKKVEKLGKTTNRTQNEMGKLRKELRDAKSDMLQAEEGSEEYARALARVADIQFRLKDVNDKARLAVRDFGEVAKNTARAVAGLSGGFTATIGVMGLFAGENENLAKAILGIQSALAVTQGLSAFAESIEDMKDLFNGLKLPEVNEGIGEIGKTAASSADDISKLASETAVLSSNMAGTAGVGDKLEEGLNKVNKSISENGKNYEALNDLVESYNDKLRQTQREINNLNNDSEDYVEKLEELKDKEELLTNNRDKASESLSQLNEETEKNVKANDKASKSIGSFASSIGKSLLSMGAFMLVIGGVTYLISKLIEAINKVPDDIKLKLELEENIIGDTQKAMEKIAQIRQNITIASNKKEIDLIKEKLVSEKIATEKELKGLNDSKSLLNAAFWDEYIENVKLVAENEYLIRRDIELRLQKELNESKYRQIANEETFLQSVFGGAVKTARKEFEAAYKEYDIFQKTFYRNGNLKLNPIKFDIGSATKPTGGKIDETEVRPDTFLNLGTPTKEQIKNSEKNIESYLKNIFKKANDFIKKSIGNDPDLAEAANTLTTIFEGEIVNVNTPTSTDNLQKRFDNIDERRKKFVEDERDAFEKQMELYQSYTTSIGTISDAVSGIYDARMQVVDNYYNAEAALINNSLLTEEAKNEKLAKLDIERHEKQKKLLEAQKAFRIATVGMDLASGLMGIYTRATLPVAAGGVPSPLNWIQGGLEAAALTAQSIASIAQIRAQQLDAPTNNSASSGSGLAFAALNPSKSAMTTKEENLNMIQKNANKDYNPVVRVSDINRVQNSVKVREKNSVY